MGMLKTTIYNQPMYINQSIYRLLPNGKVEQSKIRRINRDYLWVEKYPYRISRLTMTCENGSQWFIFPKL